MSNPLGTTPEAKALRCVLGFICMDYPDEPSIDELTLLSEHALQERGYMLCEPWIYHPIEDMQEKVALLYTNILKAIKGES